MDDEDDSPLDSSTRAKIRRMKDQSFTLKGIAQECSLTLYRVKQVLYPKSYGKGRTHIAGKPAKRYRKEYNKVRYQRCIENKICTRCTVKKARPHSIICTACAFKLSRSYLQKQRSLRQQQGT